MRAEYLIKLLNYEKWSESCIALHDRVTGVKTLIFEVLTYRRPI